MRRPKKNAGHPAIHTVEEATQLLRQCSASNWAWWFGGSAPFAVGLLHFVSDMSRAASASDRLPGAALGLALLYWWMKVAQAVFSDGLLRQLNGDIAPAPLPLRGKLRFVTSQALIHSTASWVLLGTSLAMIPFGWAYAAYHNSSVLALSVFRSGGRTRDLVRSSLEQSRYSQRQNHSLMFMLSIVACIIWLNFFVGTVTVASLSKVFTGEENAISRNPMMMFSTGVMAATMAVAYLVMGPVVKAIYVLRCFYSLSRRNGQDLEVAFRASALPVVSALLLCLALPASRVEASPQSLSVKEATTPSRSVSTGSKDALNPEKLDKSIREVLSGDMFQWRMPRDAKPKDKNAPKGWLESFVDDIGKWVQSLGKSMGDGFERWLKDKFKDMLDRPSNYDGGGGGGTAWTQIVSNILYGLLAVLVIVLVLILVRQWRRLPPAPMKVEGATPQVNLESDQVVATQLPENEWLRLAEEKIGAGEYRLAMRAFFLATLAHLGERKLLGIRRTKSNGDYVRELALRARDRDELQGRFGDSVRTFDWAWYGWHDVTVELLTQFRENHQIIISDGNQGQ